jgi:hypothetical protein
VRDTRSEVRGQIAEVKTVAHMPSPNLGFSPLQSDLVPLTF